MGKAKRRAISLFSGAGGMDIGVKSAGFRVLAAVEFDRFAAETLRLAARRERSGTRVIEADIREVSPKHLLEDLKIGAGELDLLFGGPPCQSFSLAGKQLGLDDERGMLLFQMARFARALKPKTILVEQVKGLVGAKGKTGRRGEVLELFLKDLEDAGYHPKWKVLVAADYGVAQLRERLFVVATRGENGFTFPSPTHAPREMSGGLFPLAPYVTVGEVLKGMGKPQAKVKGTTEYPDGNGHVDVTPERDRERIRVVPEGSYLAAQTHAPRELLGGLTAKDTTKYLRTHRGRPSNTLRCGEIFYHPTDDRYLTPREYMRIHGYPDDYVLAGPIRSRTGAVRNLDQHRQVANSVPPRLAEVLARQINGYLNAKDL